MPTEFRDLLRDKLDAKQSREIWEWIEKNRDNAMYEIMYALTENFE